MYALLKIKVLLLYFTGRDNYLSFQDEEREWRLDKWKQQRDDEWQQQQEQWQRRDREYAKREQEWEIERNHLFQFYAVTT